MPTSRWIIILFILSLHGGAFAQSGPSQSARDQASVRFRRGVELFQDDAYRAALVEFERAYELAPDYRLLYNIAQARFELQDFLGATQAYEKYLEQGGSVVPSEQRVEVEGALRALRKRVGRISLTVNRDGADVFIDDSEIGKTPIHTTIPVNVGRHRIAIRAADGASGTKMVDVAGDEITEVAVELSDPAPTASREATAPQGMPLQRKLAVAGWSAGGALLLGSLVTGMLALNADKDLDDLFKRANPDARTVSEQRDKIQMLALTTDVLLATGAALAVTGTALWLFSPRADAKRESAGAASAKLSWDVGLGSLAVRGRF